MPWSGASLNAPKRSQARDRKLDERQIEPVVAEDRMHLMSSVMSLVLSFGRALSLVLAVCTGSSATAQERAPAAAGATAALPLDATSPTPGAVTGKERLGGKWTDEQRIDNCKVPSDRRGTQPRSDTCSIPTE